jgi:hypothetical protein
MSALKPRGYRLPSLTGLLALLILSQFGEGRALADPVFDLDDTLIIEPGQSVSITIRFTKDGKTIQQVGVGSLNLTNKRVRLPIMVTAPPGTNDQSIRERWSKPGGTALVQSDAVLPPGQVADFAQFLRAHGFVSGGPTFDSPSAVGDPSGNGVIDGSDVSLFAVLTDVNAFVPFANQANFPLGGTLMTDSQGHLPGIAGLTFYLDEAFTMPYANGRLLVTDVASEAAVPEPASLSLLAVGVAGAAVLCRWFRRRR